MQIPVLDSRKRPLMPTNSVRARLLLKMGRAKAYWNKLGIFCIILQKEVEPDNQKIVVGIDPGSKFEGWSVVGTKQTILNGESEAPWWVKDAVEVRANMRGARRFKLWNRAGKQNKTPRNRTKSKIPPSTYARWNAKLRILVQLQKILPITDVAVEDIKARTLKATKQKPNRRYNSNFSPLEVGKSWFYNQIKESGLTLHLKQGYETKALRDCYNLKKVSNKAEKSFNAHTVDAWVLAASVSGALKPTWLGLFYWVPIRLHRRQLHAFQPSKGNIRRPYGGTRSMGLSRGTLVKHIKYGLTYIGGTLKERVSLHSIATGKRLTQNAKPSDLEILTTTHWRSQLIPILKGGVSVAQK